MVNNFNSHVCVFPESSGKLSSVGTQDILDLDGKETNKKLLGADEVTYNYKYTNIQPVEIRDTDIKIGHDGISVDAVTIDFKDIVHAEVFSVKKLDYRRVLSRSGYNFMNLVVARYNCPYCDNHRDYLGSLSTHISEIHDEEYEIEKIKKENKDLSYIYFMPRGGITIEKAGDNKQAEMINEPNVTKEDFETIVERIKKEADNLDQDVKILNHWVEKPGELRIEGVEEGSSNTRGTISARTESEGVSRGVQVGPFTKGKSKSQGSVEGKIESYTTDNTFSSNIDFIQIDKDGIYVESDPIIDISYSDIDRVAKRNNGIYAEIGLQTYSIMGREPHDWRQIIATIQKRIEDSNGKNSKKEGNDQSDQTPAERMRDLKQLYEDGIVSEDEFESKKEELLDEF